MCRRNHKFILTIKLTTYNILRGHFILYIEGSTQETSLSQQQVFCSATKTSSISPHSAEFEFVVLLILGVQLRHILLIWPIAHFRTHSACKRFKIGFWILVFSAEHLCGFWLTFTQCFSVVFQQHFADTRDLVDGVCT